jgi:hypothetical protein
MTPEELQRRLEQATTPDEMKAAFDEFHGSEEGEEFAPKQSLEVSVNQLQQQGKTIFGGDDDEEEEESAPARLDPVKAISVIKGQAVVEFETSGRFGNPETAYFADFTSDDLTALALCRDEDRLQNVVFILDRLKNDDSWKFEDLLAEEFLEVMISMKRIYNTPQHEHRWFCSCQDDLPESEKTASKHIIDLNNIKFTSIEECDELLRKEFSDLYMSLSDEEWTAFLERNYKEGDERRTYNRAQYIASLRISDRLTVRSSNGNVYVYRFARVRDVLQGLKIGSKEWNWKIRKKKNEATGIKQSRVKDSVLYDRKMAVEDLELSKAKAVLSATKGLALIEFNGKPVTNEADRINLSRTMPRDAVMKQVKLMEKMNFGVNHEEEFVCDLCGKTEPGLLQRTISPLELLPIATESGVSGTGHKPGNREILDTLIC